MDYERAVSEEHGEYLGDLHGSIPEITYREYEPHEDIVIFRQIGIDYWKSVNGKDLSNFIEIELSDGPTEILEIDLKMVRLIADGAKIRLALLNRDVIGFMIYHVAYDCILAVEGLYVEKPFRRKGIGINLIESLEKPLQKIFFQTHISRKPAEMFGALKQLGMNHKRLRRVKDIITWECDWEKENGFKEHRSTDGAENKRVQPSAGINRNKPAKKKVVSRKSTTKQVLQKPTGARRRKRSGSKGKGSKTT